ncbi:hypothetical protein [Larsenimonas suaedae]|uniref:EcsC family protein n=1 Tax=Larsenimonas suaedae TaxID=1851019 RepID=A0ABU1H0I6_9GAMM|nr:hypothetical protein [Larsenimonas suaedae]MCM2973748.1 hypothetical protein [Larsenimonas suaedae]MDR5897272.1 hypothetical protein [Larsenimonas suaedae]
MKDKTAAKASNSLAKLIYSTALIDRQQFLEAAFSKHYGEEQIKLAVETTPAKAGICPKAIQNLSQKTIKLHQLKATSTSFVTGVPGGWYIAATIPTDIIQVLYQGLLMAQKLAYLHGFACMKGKGMEGFDDETQHKICLMLGAVAGIDTCRQGLVNYANHLAINSTLSETKWLVPFLKILVPKVADEIKEESYQKFMGRAIPVAGGVMSAASTWYFFNKRAQDFLLHVQGYKTHEDFVSWSETIEGEWFPGPSS